MDASLVDVIVTTPTPWRQPGGDRLPNDLSRDGPASPGGGQDGQGVVG